MGSYDNGKLEVCAWIRRNFDKDATILDVGACDGKWRRLLAGYPNMDASEIFEPYARSLQGLYRRVIQGDIYDFKYKRYDLIIFGDVIEHMPVERAQAVLEYAWPRCTDMIVAVPFLYKQEPVGGNPWQRHVQDDLTREVFAQRYAGLEVLVDAASDYCYYHKGHDNV